MNMSMRKVPLWTVCLVASCLTVSAGEAFGPARLFDSTGREAMALDLEGKYLYGGAGDWFVVFDVSDPLKPKKVGAVQGVGAARQLVVQKGVAYVTSREYGVWIIDATDPAKPRIRSRFDCCELATGIDVAGDVCFCGQRQNGVEFIDVRNPDQPRHIAMRKTPESQSIIYSDGYVYSGEWERGQVTVFDAHDMTDIRQVGTLDLNGYGDGVWKQGKYLYASRGHHAVSHSGTKPNKDHLAMSPSDAAYGAGHGLDIFEFGDGPLPKLVGSVDFPKLYARGLDMWTPRTSGNLLISAQTHNGLFAVDISDKRKPRVLDRWTSPTSKNPKYPSDCVGSVAIGNGAVYAAVKGQGFFVLPCSQAKAEARSRGVLPKNAQFREAYPSDEKAWHVWKPHDVGQVRGVAVKGDTAYVACGDAGLYVLDILPGNAGWYERGKVAGREQVYDVSIVGNRLYTAEGEKGFGVYDITGAMPKEICRLPQISPARHLAFWVIALDETRLLCSDRKQWALYDTTKLPEFRLVSMPITRCPGWDKYMMDRPIGGRYYAFNECHRSVKWFDMTDGRLVAETKKNCTTLMNGMGAFGPDRAVFSKGAGYKVLKPLEGDPPDGSIWPRVMTPPIDGRRMDLGIPRSDGRFVAFTGRIRRQAVLLDLANPDQPVLVGGWKLSGNPDVAAFHNGKVIIPCAYQGLLLQR